MWSFYMIIIPNDNNNQLSNYIKGNVPAEKQSSTTFLGKEIF